MLSLPCVAAVTHSRVHKRNPIILTLRLTGAFKLQQKLNRYLEVMTLLKGGVRGEVGRTVMITQRSWWKLLSSTIITNPRCIST